MHKVRTRPEHDPALARELAETRQALRAANAERARVEERLQRMQEIFNQAEQIAHVGAWWFDITESADVNDWPLTWSAETYRIFGHEPGAVAVTNEMFVNHVHPDDRARVADTFNSAVAEKRPYGIEHRIVRADGSVGIVLEHGDMRYDDQGRLRRIVGTVQDITDRARTQEELRQEKTLLRTVINAAPNMIFVRGAGGSFLLANEAMDRFLGARVEGKKEADFAFLVSSERMSDQQKEDVEIMRTGQGRTSETRLTGADGQAHWLLATKIPLVDPDGTSTKLLYVVTDITERKKAEEALEKREREFRTLAENLPDLVARLDIPLRLVYMNPAARKVFGIPGYGFSGKTIRETGIPDWLAAAWESDLRKIIETGKNTTMEFQVPGPGGERYFAVTNVPEKNEKGAIVSILTVARDITEVKRSDRQVDYLKYHDRVTDLYNRTYFEEELRRLDTDRELPLSIIMGDINNLRLTNEVYGQEEGDRLLARVAEIMRVSCRREDIIARWGGDEYIMLLPRTDRATAETIARRIKTTCAGTRVTAIQCSIALGVATKEASEYKITDTLQLAEERLNKSKVIESEENRRTVISSMLSRIGSLDHDTREHTRRMQDMAIRVGKALSLSQRQLDDLALFAALHDIGKAGIPGAILEKPGQLTPTEWDKMKQHTELGYRIAHAFPELSRVSEAILDHHERWDGRGYPRGLTGDAIPLLVRILTIIDAYDVMTHARSYKHSLSKDEAIAELERGAAKQFDPELVKIFVRVMTQGREALIRK